MRKNEFKKKLLDICIAAQSKTIDNIREAMDDAQKSADDYIQPKDNYDSYRTQLYRKREMFAQQLNKAHDQLEIFKKINPALTLNMVEFGAVVITNTQRLFVATSIGKINMDEEIYFTISPLVPFFYAMKGKKKNEDFVFRDQKFKIVDLF